MLKKQVELPSKVSANVKIAIQYFENFGGANAPNAPPGCAPGVSPDVGQHINVLDQRPGCRVIIPHGQLGNFLSRV